MYNNKYLKYKNKYLELKKGGTINELNNPTKVNFNKCFMCNKNSNTNTNTNICNNCINNH